MHGNMNVKCILSTLVTYSDDDRKTVGNVMIITDMWQNIFYTCAFVGFMTLIQVICIVLSSVSLKRITKLRWRSQHEKYVIKFKAIEFNKLACCYYCRCYYCCTLRNPPLTFGGGISFYILAHPVFKMWIIQEPKKVALWNKRHFEEKKRRLCNMFKIFSMYICWINIRWLEL